MPTTRRDVLASVAAIGTSAAVIGALQPRAVRAAEKADVIVIGAGFAGLKAAIELKEQGAKVIVLEANTRVGGRAYTADHFATKPELGASQIGPDYARVLDMCTRLNVKLAPGANINAPFTFYIGGKLIKKEDWKSSPQNKTVGDERAVLPPALFSFYLRKHMPLKAAEDWLEASAAQYDVAPGPWLKSKGVSDEALRLMEGGLAPDAWESSLLTLMQEEARGMTIFGTASTDSSKDRFAQYAENSQHVEGGTSRLPEAMAKFMGDAVLTGKIVTNIDMTKTDITVGCLDGTRYQAAFAISAIPFKPLNRVSINPPLQGMQAEAVRNMPYNNNTQVHFAVKAPYWEQDGMDASLWSDGPVTNLRQAIGYDGSRTRAMAFCVGKKGDRIDQLAPKDRAAFVLSELERMRPSLKGKLEIMGVHSWPQYTFVEGCRHSYGPGQVTRWAQDMIKPHGQLHFAGEHTRRLDVGMESAMESGERAAIEVITRMAG